MNPYDNAETLAARACAHHAAISSSTASAWTCSTSAWSRTTAGSSSRCSTG